MIGIPDTCQQMSITLCGIQEAGQCKSVAFQRECCIFAKINSISNAVPVKPLKRMNRFASIDSSECGREMKTICSQQLALYQNILKRHEETCTRSGLAL